MASKHKPSLLLLIILAIFWSLSSLHASWFSHDDSAKDDIIVHLQDEVEDEQHDNGRLVVLVVILSTGVVVALVTGAAIGSKARKAARQAGGDAQ